MNTKSLLVGLLLAAPFTVDAGGLPTKTSGPYLGLGSGYSKIDARNDYLTVSDEDLSFRVLGGYRFAQIPQIPLPFSLKLDLGFDFGIEVAYVDLGEAEVAVGGVDVSIDLDAVAASGVVYWPINPSLDIVAKAGLYAWDGKVKALDTELLDDSGTDLSFGLGIAWQTGTGFGAQFEVESLDALDGVWVATLSATYQFK
ncbi:MAG TPA: outer membrane beta-barrel protein [Gammaproteobacteria bacterium]|nr:hypothetical protein [Chromatiales bacterium]MCP4927366.1 porin family protein [Gammaproteobacteria bacterium]MDP7296021.1 outer membrane beta-barrel protein [Gammaproteobacteria bacterium]HJP39856.1 outer membrane beta-barrel protein [Gammaproteobacteria bacterium]